MTLLDEINAAINSAMKAQQSERLVPLRMLKTALVNRRIEKGRELDQSESLQVVSTLVKQRRDSIDQFTTGGRRDLADKEAAEIKVLEAYLPPAVDAEEIERTVEQAISDTGASGPQDLCKVMKAAMSKLASRGVDGQAVNAIVRKKLTE